MCFDLCVFAEGYMFGNFLFIISYLSHSRQYLQSMDDELKLPVNYNGEEREYPFRVIPQGFATRFAVLVNDVEVIFERDDQGDFRAMIYNDAEKHALFEPELLKSIAAVIKIITG